MESQKHCPRCRGLLEPSEDVLVCSGCDGRFAAETPIDARWLEDLPQDHPSTSVTCPGCGHSMTAQLLGDTEIDICGQCAGVWLDPGETLVATDRGSVQKFMLYSLSLPERVVRSTIGVAAGAAKETAALLIPQSFQSAKTYELVVTNSLGFLTGSIGGVENPASGPSEQDDFMARKAVGNFVDLAGMATLHVSPVWLLAIVSDVAYGTSSYVEQLADELQQQGIIDDSSAIHHVDDVLNALQDGTGNAASLFDTPPLSVDQLRETLERTRESLRDVDYRAILPEAELKRYWSEMQEISDVHGVSLLGVSAAVAMNTLDRLQNVAQGTLTSVRVAGGLLNQHVLGHYRESLHTIQEQGLFESLRESSGPYVEAVWNNFATDRPTWTEDLLSGRLVVKGWRKVSSWIGGKPSD